MPRPQPKNEHGEVILTADQAVSGLALLDRTLVKPDHDAAWRQFEIARAEYWEFRRLAGGEDADSSVGEAELAAHYYASMACAILLFRDPRIQQRYLRVINVHKALLALITAEYGRLVIVPGLRMARSRGPLPGPKPNRQKRADEWFAARETKVRSRLRESLHREPTDIEVAVEIPLPYRSYRRYRERLLGRNK